MKLLATTPPRRSSGSSSLQLACFSPLIMLLTFSFEFLAAAFIAWRYRLNRRAVLMIAILINLGLFQVAEWNVCANAGAQLWARIGFVGTALLIPLGVNFVHELHPTAVSRRAGWLAWAGALGFIAWFLFVPNSVSFVFCGGNYSIYRLTTGLSYLYSAFYWFWLVFTVWLSAWSTRLSKKPMIRRALLAYIAGYLSFMLPTLISNAATPELLKAVPSVLCGFAIFFAIILISLVAPASLERRRR